MVQELLCRPDKDHYCIECCSERAAGGCCNLGTLPDGTRGCKGYGDRTDLGGFPQPDNCTIVDCLAKFPFERRTKIQEEIKALPPGEFMMGKILRLSS